MVGHPAPASELTPESRAHLARIAASALPLLHECTVEEARANSEAGTPVVVAPYDGPVEITVEEAEVAGADGPLAARVYRPSSAPATDAPALVYLHGGGWVIGTLDGYDDLCRRLAVASGGVVVNVDYRLAPEHPFPAPVEDAVAATRDVLTRAEELGVDPGRVAVGGDSAGGSLAIAVARRAAREGWPSRPVGHLLVYPSTDVGGTHASKEEFAVDHYLTADGMDWFETHYAPDGALRAHTDLRPAHAEDLAGTAPAHVLVASHDPLRDEGLAYAEALASAGVDVEVRMAQGMLHGFLRWTRIVPEAAEHIEALGGVLRRWWGTASG
jgi:acetyl esterase